MIRSRLSALVLMAVLPGAGQASLWAQDHGSIVGTPFSTTADEADGAKSFKSQCAACHGLGAEGGSNGPSLTTGTFRHGGSDEALFQTIDKGVAGTAMAAFPLNGQGYLAVDRLSPVGQQGSGSRAGEGNVAAGERLYRASGCAACHTVAGEGGLTRPNLTGIISRQTVAQITNSLLEPDADVAPDYWSLALG